MSTFYPGQRVRRIGAIAGTVDRVVRKVEGATLGLEFGPLCRGTQTVLAAHYAPCDGRERVAHDLRAKLGSARWQDGPAGAAITISVDDAIKLLRRDDASDG